ncbi:MAG: glycosyltransferase family 4 protein [Armatimonadetes bacterium]|nr:glycosyltransferase family 4 protein [Armatimonadota bacterium]
MNSRTPTVILDGSLVGAGSTGDSAYWEGLLYGLGSSSCDLRLIALGNGNSPPSDLSFGSIQFPVSQSQNRRLWNLVRFPLLARKLKADVVHTQYNFSPLFRVPVITTIHDVSFFIGSDWFEPRDRAILQRMIPKSAARAASIITVSQTSKREIEEHIPAAAGKVEAIYNALDPRFSPPERRQAMEILEGSLGLKAPFALTVGTRWPRKNMKLAVQAIMELGESEALRLVVSGKAGWGPELEHPRIVRPGFVSRFILGALYAASEMYLAPSFHEGFGIPLLEAWAAKTPVICSKGGALPEVAGDAAAVMPDFNVSTWTAAIRQLRTESGKVSALVERGEERLAHFSWSDSAQKTIAVYKKVMQVDRS